MQSNVKKSDSELKNDVLAELEYEPSVKVTDIGVLVKDGAVTLNGYATSYGEKCDAVCAAKRVAGVNAIADDIEVKLPDSQCQTDGDIAATAAHQIKSFLMIPAGAVKITVREGWITLEGEVEWKYQRDYAENAVVHLKGVKGVSNLITIKPSLAPAGVQMASTERVDTRVLQVIYSFERGNLPMFAGQQMDVFIDASEPPQKNKLGFNHK